MKDWLGGLGAWCMVCNRLLERKDKHLCPTCYQNLPWFKTEICFICGHHHLKGDCDEDFAKDIAEYQALFLYQEPVSAWIAGLKYGRNLLVGRLLKALVTQWFIDNQEWLTQWDMVLPVPIHGLRLKARGFNQTTYLLTGQKLLPVRGDWVKKTRYTKHQAALGGRQRFTNLKRSFASSTEVEGKAVLLFDDVCTTGQTLDQIARTLKNQGVERIGALSLCRSKKAFS